jgi:DNA polymerase-3 subunit gamma/tau
VSSGPSLYRRHRPRTFAEVVGQEPVVRTLRHAVEQSKVHHAYLFVGSRGTGKTSMAKILAACLNCERGPTIDPCGGCDSCTSIASASSLDVIEMDAASNNSVDDIRELRESVAYAPVSGRHKVYILDEAHMLSSQAWNAFLKTLEEPPPNTIFVLATTEAQKVLPTVVDRCHRFDFARPTVEQIAGVLRRAAEAEAIRIPSEAIALIARAATGSFRDALGTLEQLITYSGAEISLQDVVAVLGVAESELLYEAIEAVGSHDPRRALLAVARGTDGGREPVGLIRDLEVHARELMVVQTLDGQVPAQLSITPDADRRLADQAQRIPPADVVALLEALARALEAVKAGADGRTQLELALIKAAAPEVDASTRALLARIERLEGLLSGGPQTQAGAVTAPPSALEATPVAPPTAPPPTPPPPTAAPPTAPPAPAPAASPDPAPRPALAAVGGAVAAPVPVAGAANLPLDLETVADLWKGVVETLAEEQPLLAAVMVKARPVALEGQDLIVAFCPEDAFLRRRAEDQASRSVVTEVLKALCGHSLRLAFELREIDEEHEPAAVALTDQEWVARFLVEFDAEELEQDETVAPKVTASPELAANAPQPQES